MKAVKLLIMINVVLFLLLYFSFETSCSDKEEIESPSNGITITENDKYFLKRPLYITNGEILISSPSEPANNSYFLIENMPQYWNVKIGVSSRETFRVMGKANNYDANSADIFISAFQEGGENPLNPLEKARKYSHLDDADDEYLKCGVSWELVKQDKNNDVNIFLFVDVTFSKSWKDLKKEEKTSHLSANPFVRGEDDGWVVSSDI